MQIDVILGLQWGDEGKGKIVDYLANDYDIVARFQGGPNAGHTLIFDGKKYVLHTIPSGIFRQGLINIIGNGVVVDPTTLQREIVNILPHVPDLYERMLLAKKAHLILPTHRYLDVASEAAKGSAKIGSTLKGIGPTYMDKTGRNGLRVGDILTPQFLDKYNALKAKHLDLLRYYPQIDFDLEGEETKWFAAIEDIKKLQLIDSEYYIHSQLKAGKRILAEGAQGSMLDIDFGTYPYVTSSNTVTAGVCSGLGVPPQAIGKVIGVTKAYCTRVGSGPFPTELFDETGDFLRKEGHEFGSTTGRPRRCGWIDLLQLQYTILLNGVTHIALTKIDVLNNLTEIKAANAYEYLGEVQSQLPYDLSAFDVAPQYTAYEGWNCGLENAKTYDELPEAARNYIKALEEFLGVPASLISTSPDRNSLIVR